MSKTLQTKNKILNLLKKKEMTITGLSQELGLSGATISQHMEELQRMGAVEKIDNEHFRRLKYYKATAENVQIMARYAVGLFALAVILGASFYIYNNSTAQPVVGSNNTAKSYLTSNGLSSQSSTSTTPQVGGTGAMMCPMEFYSLNGSIQNYSGLSMYYINSNMGRLADYVIPNDSSGTLYIKETISNVLPEPSNSSIRNRQHYAFLQQANRSSNSSTSGIGLAISPVNFTVVSNETVYMTLAVTTNKTVQNGTYWLRIDGPCGGGVTPVLLTIGNGPYTGTVSIAPQIYA